MPTCQPGFSASGFFLVPPAELPFNSLMKLSALIYVCVCSVLCLVSGARVAVGWVAGCGQDTSEEGLIRGKVSVRGGRVGHTTIWGAEMY